VSIALAEAGDFPASMALHVVKNNKDVHEAGAAHMLMPGFDVVASSHEDDDIPNCEFDLPPSSQPYFIVPSAAKGELGAFRIIITATEGVEVIRIPGNFREPRQSNQSFKLKWLQRDLSTSSWVAVASRAKLPCCPGIATRSSGSPCDSRRPLLAPPSRWHRWRSGGRRRRPQ